MKIEQKSFTAEDEKKLIEEWNKKYDFTFNPKTKKEIFSIDNPPTYPSGKWHVGAAAAYSMLDVVARAQRMLGKEVLFPFCLDNNGINIELTVQKKFGKSMFDYKREEFIKICAETIQEFKDYVKNTYKRAGISSDYNKYIYETDSPEFRAFSQVKFIELFKKGMIVEELRPNNYCPVCRTTLADADIFYVERDTNLNFIKWKVKETGEWIENSTTRPELICACGVLLVNPDDGRYKHLHGKTALTPIFGKEVKIVPHPHADPNFGTGIVMECSYGDYDDIKLFRELKLKPTAAIDIEGRMTEAAGRYKGMKIEEARAAIIDDLKKEGLLTKQVKWKSRVPICERSKSPIEFISLKEWYVKQVEYLKEIKKLSKKLKIIPEKHRIILENWIDSLTIDWPISRNRYYHTEIPLWYCKKCGEILIPEPGKYYQPWKQAWPGKKCTKCGSTDIRGETRVFDTWMDSSCTPLYLAEKWLDGKKVTLRPQGIEIIRTWLYYSILKSFLLNKNLPFEFAVINGLGLDKHGKKMSKSLGNVIEPIPVMDKYGSDAFRLWACSEANVGENFRVDEEKIGGAGKTVVKLWNISKLISMFEIRDKPKKLNPTDEWIISELNKLTDECISAYQNNDIYLPANRIREFIWNVYAPHYIEMAKSRAYAGDESALYTLHQTLKTLLKLIAPVAPFVTDMVYTLMYDGKIHSEEFEKPVKAKDLTAKTEMLVKFNSQVWKEKKDAGKPLNSEISGVPIPKELEDFEDDLKKMHRLM